MNVVWNSVNIHKIRTRSMFESQDDLIAKSYSQEVVAIDSRGLTVVAITEVFVQKVNANIFRKLLTESDNLHMI